jgi:hypothetical protein
MNPQQGDRRIITFCRIILPKAETSLPIFGEGDPLLRPGGCSSVKAATDLALLRAVAGWVEVLPPQIDKGLARPPKSGHEYARQSEFRSAGAGFLVRVSSSTCRQHYGGLAEQSTLPRHVSTLARMGSTQSSLEPWLRWTS